MKVLYVVQRYGEKIVGGSESACRMYAENLVKRGHSVDVLTSCAHSYVDWADEYEPGSSEINGVTVHRLRVIEPRTDQLFAPLHDAVMKRPRSLPKFEQQRWARLMGPRLAELESWLLINATSYDVVVFMTYLYTTATTGLPTVSGRVPTILQPTAHDEPPAYVGIYHSLFRQPDAFLFFTPEERDVVRDLYQVNPQGPVIGIGMETDEETANHEDFLAAFPKVHSNYIIYVGRLDASKGVGELIRFFLAYKSRAKSDLQLVLAGDGNIDIPDDPSIVVTGFLSEEMKKKAISGSVLLVQPSYFESFSIVLCEAWIQKRPALVQGKCEVLRGQARRSGGALPYEGFAEFEAALETILQDKVLAQEMGGAGLKYVKQNYNWDVVVSEFEEAALIAIKNFASRRLRTTPLR